MKDRVNGMITPLRLGLAAMFCIAALAVVAIGSGTASAKTCGETGFDVKHVSCNKGSKVQQGVFKNYDKCLKNGCTVKKFKCKPKKHNTKFVCKKGKAQVSFYIGG